MASNAPEPNTNESHDHPSDEARPDVAAAVDELLNKLSTQFASVSSELFSKMDDMSRRIDKLETELVESRAKEGSPAKP